MIGKKLGVTIRLLDALANPGIMALYLDFLKAKVEVKVDVRGY